MRPRERREGAAITLPLHEQLFPAITLPLNEQVFPLLEPTTLTAITILTGAVLSCLIQPHNNKIRSKRPVQLLRPWPPLSLLLLHAARKRLLHLLNAMTKRSARHEPPHIHATFLMAESESIPASASDMELLCAAPTSMKICARHVE